MPDDPTRRVACPRCSAQIRIHPRTQRLADHPERGERGAPKCSFGGDYLPGFVPETPIRYRRRRGAAA